MGIQSVDVIVDLQYGDTGKGKVAHHLAKSGFYDIVLRYNGGSNAGHTVYHNGEVIVTHQVPVGVLHGITSIIGRGCVVNVSKLIEEIHALNSAGIDTKGLIKIDKRAHMVTDEHIHEDTQDNIIGTTGQGIGPAYRDKYNRIGIPIGHMHMSQYHHLFEVIDIYDYLFVHDDKYNILCEGAQGFHLDIDWGEYPYVTSSHCTVGSVCLNGIPPHKIRKVYGVMKAYETYVGNNPAKSAFTDTSLDQIQIVGNEFGATTGRKRIVEYLHIDRVIMAMNINGVTDVIINKIDVLEEVNCFKILFDTVVFEAMDSVEFVNIVNGNLRKKSERDINIIWSSNPNTI
jgi:adenylosuccinate synthase